MQTPTPAQSIGEAFGDQHVTLPVQSSTATPLLPATAYSYRVLATNHSGTATAQGTFTTTAIATKDIADERGWELVSPPDSEGANIVPISGGATKFGVIQASATGSAIAYVADAPIGEPEGSRSNEPAHLLSIRTPRTGWSTQAIDTPERSVGGLPGATEEYRLFSEDLSLALVQPFEAKGLAEANPLAAPPLSPPLTEAESGHQERTIYLRDDVASGPDEASWAQALTPEACEPGIPETCDFQQAAENGERSRSRGETPGDPGYLPLVTPADVQGADSAAPSASSAPHPTSGMC